MKVRFEKLQLSTNVKPPGKGQGGGALPWYTAKDGYDVCLDSESGLISITKDGETRLVPVHLMLWADPELAPAKPVPVAKAAK